MDQQHQQHQAGGPSPPAGAHPHHLRQGQSPLLAPYNPEFALPPSDLSYHSYAPQELSDPSNAFNITPDINQRPIQSPPYPDQSQGEFTQSLLSANSYNPGFTLFPSTTEPQFNTNTSPFASDTLPRYGGVQDNPMPTQHATQHLSPEPQQPGSAQHSPSFNQHQFSPPATRGPHSRNASLTPQEAFWVPAGGHMGVDWNQMMGMQGSQFRDHRRTPSGASDLSSAAIPSGAPSPNLTSVEFAEQLRQQGTPESEFMSELQRIIPNVSLSDHGSHSPNPSQANGRTPAHSPAISPRMNPQQLHDMNPQHQYLLQGQNNSFGPPASYGSMQAPEQFPTLQQGSPDPQMNQFQIQAPPQIQVDYAPSAGPSGSGPGKTLDLDVDSLTPPNRGRPKQRPRSVTDPFNSGGSQLGHRRTPSASATLSPNDRSGHSRSLSPANPSGSGAGRLSPSSSPNRRRSRSEVASNAVALRLVEADNHAGETGAGGSRRVQKHQANYQCQICPKRFTRAYNLRSHTRTHTDERPFKCGVCLKAFARQHDKKRHEGLHSGVKKFPCNGPLKAGGEWGCGRKFARADALGRHFRSEAGRSCIKPLLDEEQQMQQQAAAQNMGMGMGMGMGMNMQQPMMGMGGVGNMMMPVNMDLNPAGYPPPLNPNGHFPLPAAIYAQFPQLRDIQWPENDMGGGSGIEDELSGQSNFEASDYDEPDEAGYVSGPGTGFGPGSVPPGYVENGYSSDFGL